jgi:alpha-glucosidase
MDAIRPVMKDPLLRDNPPNPETRGSFHRPLGDYDRQLHVYDMGHPDLHRVLRDVRHVLDEYSSAEHPRMSIGEIHIYDPVELCRYYGESLDELHLPFFFGLLNTPWSAAAIRQAVDAYEAALPAGAWPNYVVGNHDEPRIATRVGEAGARLAMLLLLTLRGTPTLYNGDELGLPDVPVPPERVQDPLGKVYPQLSRDPCRSPIPWDRGPNASFCPQGVEPWLPLAPHAGELSVATQAAAPCSMLSLTRRLLALRRARPALVGGSYRAVEDVPEDCLVYTREADGQRLLTALNFAEDERAVAVPPASLLVSTHLDREGPVEPGRLWLRPTEGCLLELR